MSSLAETNYQAEIYLDGVNPIFLAKYMPPPDNLTPFIGDMIAIQGYDGMFKVTRITPSNYLTNKVPVDSASIIYVEAVTANQPETNDDTMNPIEYQWIYQKVF